MLYDVVCLLTEAWEFLKGKAFIKTAKFLLFRVVESEGTVKPRQPRNTEGAGLRRAKAIDQ